MDKHKKKADDWEPLEPTPSAEAWEEVEFLDSSAGENLKQKCCETFSAEKIDELEHYTILEELGRGKMGIVYKAVHQQDKKLYALKILPEKVLHDPKAVQRFFQEICIHNLLNHDNIIRLHKIGVCRETVFIVMEFVLGYDLDTMLRKKGPLSEVQALTLIVPILDAIQYAHSLNIVHRDLKPANILIEEVTQKPKIADFGLAKFSTEDMPKDEAFGTPAYMSPEQIISPKDTDIRTDIYAIGGILYHMLYGNRPYYEIASPQILLKAKIQDDPQDLAELVPNLSPKILNIVRMALKRNPNSRYQTPQDFLHDAQEALEEAKQRRNASLKIITKTVEEIHQTPTSLTFQPVDQELFMMTASRYEVDPILGTFQREMNDFSKTPVGEILEQEAKTGECEFSETLLSITMVTEAALKIPPGLEKKLVVILATGDLLKNIVAMLKGTLPADQRKILEEFKYLLLLRGNSLTKREAILQLLNQGESYIAKKVEELGYLTQSSVINQKVRKYFEAFLDSILKKYDEVFLEEVKLCKDYDELECYMENYTQIHSSILKKYKNLQIIRQVKDLKKAIDAKPKDWKTLLDYYLGKKPTILHDLFKKWHNSRASENLLWNMIDRVNSLNELVAHLQRFEEKPEFKTMASRIHELINVFIGVGGQMSLQQLKTSLNFMPTKGTTKICQLVRATLKGELEQKIQELLQFEGEEHKRMNSLFTLLRNPRYHQNITLYGYDVKELGIKLTEFRAQPDNKQWEPLRQKLPKALIQLLSQAPEVGNTYSRSLEECKAKLDRVIHDIASKKTVQVLRELTDIFKVYGKINFAKEDSVYVVDGYEIARKLIQYYNLGTREELELPEKLNNDIATRLQKIVHDDRKRQVGKK